ncbi:MAG: NAD-dependent malic enzyme [Gammaproteobacteria bacterium]|nr:NAD-dependent malic enzyme [Gammaproteobacteria bacterium]
MTKRGYDLIRDPLLNKGTAFTAQERDELGLHGLLPSQHNTMNQQVKRILASVRALTAPLDKYVSLAALQDRNEHLFYRLLVDHIEELMPIVYTPTVGLATQNFSHVFQRGRGVWITPDLRGRIAEVLEAAAGSRDIRLIVATDNESILGIGDQGAGGMGISIGKLALYVAGAGIAPAATLPVSIDVGTNNRSLLDDDLYLGWPHERIEGADYHTLIDEFVEAVQRVFPGAMIQWEDFRKDNALAILDRHRSNITSFNDDIQGTSAVALAALISAARISGVTFADHRVVIHGAGAAGLGIARLIKTELVRNGLSQDQAAARVAVLDSRGLLVNDQQMRDAYKHELAWPVETATELGLTPDQRSLDHVVGAFQPTVLIGTSGQAGAFSEALVTAMAQAVERPLIMPFSNPTDRAEATPADLIRWTHGRALVATGSPFEPVVYEGRTYVIGQANNVFIFPGLGLGTLGAQASSVTDGMVSAASEALGLTVREDELARGLLFPAISRLREVSLQIALAVAKQAEADGVAGCTVDADRLAASMWSPDYPTYTGVADIS